MGYVEGHRPGHHFPVTGTAKDPRAVQKIVYQGRKSPKVNPEGVILSEHAPVTGSGLKREGTPTKTRKSVVRFEPGKFYALTSIDTNYEQGHYRIEEIHPNHVNTFHGLDLLVKKEDTRVIASGQKYKMHPLEMVVTTDDDPIALKYRTQASRYADGTLKNRHKNWFFVSEFFVPRTYIADSKSRENIVVIASPNLRLLLFPDAYTEGQ